MTNFIVPYS